MPLLDHFHPPLKGQRHWESFHGMWASALAQALNAGLLPADYFAEFQVHVGSHIRVDVATFEKEEHARGTRTDGAATALAVQTYAPPMPSVVIPAVFPRGDTLSTPVSRTKTTRAICL